MKNTLNLWIAMAAFVTVRAEVAVISPQDVAAIAKRSLPFIEKEGVRWIEERKCASCHQIPAMLWSLNSAARAGLGVDRAKVEEWTTWSLDWTRWTNAGAKNGEEKSVADNIDTMTALMLGRHDTPDRSAAWLDLFRERILKNQLPDGSWKPGGQLPLTKRPERERKEVTTLWTLLALASTGPAGPSIVEAEKRAQVFLDAAQPGESTEWQALQVLVKRPGGEGFDVALDQLLKSQNPDGGWAWLRGEGSDALGTGLALYAATRAGTALTHPAMQRACQFLQRTQQADGSWPVPSTRTKDANKIKPTATYWGTAWAVVGLLELSHHATALPLPDSSPR